MKSTKIALITLALLASATASAHDSTASATGSNVVVSGSTANVSSNGTGSATASVGNVGFAATTVKTNGDAGFNLGSSSTGSGGNKVTTFTDTRQGSVGVSGVTETYNRTDVATTSTGAASAFGAAGGLAAAQASGTGNFHTTGSGPQGSVNGASNAYTATGAVSVGNGTSTQVGGQLSAFNSQASADITTTTQIKGFLSPIGIGTQISQGDVKNAATSVNVQAGTTFNTSTSTGTAIGGVLQNSTANGNAASSVAGLVSSSH